MPQAKWTGFIIINELVKKLSIYYTLLLLDPLEGLESLYTYFRYDLKLPLLKVTVPFKMTILQQFSHKSF